MEAKNAADLTEPERYRVTALLERLHKAGTLRATTSASLVKQIQSELKILVRPQFVAHLARAMGWAIRTHAEMARETLPDDVFNAMRERIVQLEIRAGTAEARITQLEATMGGRVDAVPMTQRDIYDAMLEGARHRRRAALPIISNRQDQR